MQNQNQKQNQGVPKQVLPGQAVNPSPMGGIPRPMETIHPNQPVKLAEKSKTLSRPMPLASKASGGFLMKIAVIVLAVLLIGLMGAGAYFYLDLAGKVKNIDKKIGDDHNTVAENKDKIAKLETSVANLDSLKQKV